MHMSTDAATTSTTTTAPAATTPAEGTTPTTDDGKGGKAAVLADLATERDKRQALETQIAALQTAQQAQTDALAKAFGLKPEETSDVSALASQVTALQEQFAQTQHDNLVLTVANEHGISDKDDLALLADAKDEAAVRRLAERIAKAGEGTSHIPKPDLTQGGSSAGGAARTPAQEFGDFINRQLS
jgi:septal ring factor EnvC (AmiA/AmiB activator)